MLKRTQIAIIGAGIGGLTLAPLLRRLGLDVQIFEQAPAFARVGAGIQMSPNPVKVLRELGLERRLRASAYQPRSMVSREAETGDITFDYPLGAAAEEKYGAPYLLMHRGDLHAALAECNSAQVQFGMKLRDVSEMPTGGTKLAFESGTEVLADAVIGADGVHSVIRKALLGEERPRFTGRVAYRTTFPAELIRDAEVTDCTKWWGADRHIVIYPINPRLDEVYFTTSVPEDWQHESWSTKGDVRQLRETFAAFHPEVRAVLHACPEVHKWAIYERDPLPFWTRGCMVLLGDACHPMTPYMAQGAATAIEDALVLARCIEASGSNRIPQAFARFERTRKDRTSKIQYSSHLNSFMHRETNPDWVFGYDARSVDLA